MDPTSFPQAFDRIAYLGRVSTPKQKIEHQRESVLRFAEQHGLNIPPQLRFEDKVRRHKQGAEGEQFGRLMKLVEARQLDWIVIATFDRWGISDKDDIFILRKKLKQHDVQLWSVADDLNITGADDASFWRVAARAEGATAYVSAQAEKNIQKMVSMSEGGWASSGNAPFGLDLVCYSLADRTRPLFRVVRLRYKPHLYRILWYTKDGAVEKDEVSNNMPPRDKKATGYRMEPGIDEEKLKAVRLMFQLYDQNMGFGAISDNLWDQGFKHYDKPFGFHGIETILANSAYIGMPAWGKTGVGQYRHAIDKQPAKVKRKSTDTLTVKKPESQYVYPTARLFDPIVDPELFARVKEKLAGRVHVNESFGKRRTRDKANHPLNGLLYCPDCDEQMVLGSSIPGKKELKRTRCFNCRRYRRTRRKECYSNSVRWDALDAATDELLKIVGERIEAVEQGDTDRLLKEAWLKETELGKVIAKIVTQTEGKRAKPKHTGGSDSPPLLGVAFSVYAKEFEETAGPLRKEVEEIDAELDAIALELPRQAAKPTIYKKLNDRAAALEARKTAIEPLTIPLTAQATAIMDQLKAIKATIDEADRAKKGELLNAFLEKVYPVFDVKIGKTTKRSKEKRSTHITGFRFVPRKEAGKVLPSPMEIGCSRTDRDSWRRRGRNARGRSSNSGRGRWSLGPFPAAAAALPGCGDETPAIHRGTTRHDGRARFRRARERCRRRPCRHR